MTSSYLASLRWPQVFAMMQLPVVGMLVLVCWRASIALENRSFRALFVAWLLSEVYLLLGLSQRLFEISTTGTVLLGIGSAAAADGATVAIAQALRVSGVRNSRRFPAALIYVLAAIYLVLLLFAHVDRFAAVAGAIHLYWDIVASVVFTSLLGYAFSRTLVNEVTIRGVSGLLPIGLYAYALDQIAMVFVHPGDNTAMAVGFFIGLLAKSLILIGVADLIAAIAVTGSADVARAREARLVIEQLYHELETPLGEMTARLAIIQNDRKMSPATKSNVVLLESVKERLFAIMEAAENHNLLIYGRTAAKRKDSSANFDPTEVRAAGEFAKVVYVNALIETAKMAVKATRSANVNFDLEYSGKCCIRVVPSEVVQILINLIHNACDAIGNRRGNIKIATKSVEVDYGDPPVENRAMVQICIEDDGEGIPEGYVDEIYVDGYTTRKGIGRGHGLAIVRKLVTMNQGTIVHKSPGAKPGAVGGCSVTLLFPRVRCVSKHDRRMEEMK